MNNVVLITVDSLRADHCGFMGYEAETTPTLDEMASEGLSFENAIAPGPSTYSSMPAIFTGRHMCQYPTGEGDAFENRGSLIRLNTRARTIAERFSELGYTTGAFTTNPYTGAHTNFARGFDHYEDFLDGSEGPLMRKAADLPIASELKHVVTLVRGDRASKPWQEYYEAIGEWVEQAPEPYFLWVFMLDPHTPYLAPDEYRNGSRLGMYYNNWKLWADKKWGIDLTLDHDSLIDLYDATIRSTDAFLSRLRDDLVGDPVIAVHSDHGEAFGEHDAYGHDAHLYEENLHVPFVVSNAGISETVSEPVSLTVLPDVLQGVATEGETPVSAPTGECVLARTLGPRKIALRGDGWKYIATVDLETNRIETEELYDLASDVGERENRAESQQEFVETCGRLAKRRLAHEREVRAVYRASEGVV